MRTSSSHSADRHRPVRSGVALAVMLVVAACSTSPGATPGNPGASNVSGATAGTAASAAAQPTQATAAAGGAPTVNCKTLSGAAIATILGMELKAADPFGDISCRWTFADKTGKSRNVVVSWSNNDTTLAGTKKASPGGEDVSIGDRGYWADARSILYVARGAHAYSVALGSFAASDPRKDIALQVAALLLAAL